MMQYLDKLTNGKTQCNVMQNNLYDELCMGILKQDMTAVRKALEKGADPNLRPDLVSPLYLATTDRNSRIVDQILLAGGQYNEYADPENLKKLGPAHATLKHVRAYRLDEEVMTPDELRHEYQIDLDYHLHFKNMEMLRPKNYGLVVSMDGKLEAEHGRNFRDSSPPPNFNR